MGNHSIDNTDSVPQNDDINFDNYENYNANVEQPAVYGSEDVANFDGVNNIMLQEFREAVKSGDDETILALAPQVSTSALHQLQHATEMRIALRRIAEVVVELESEAEDAKYESEKMGNKIAMRKTELESRSVALTKVTQYLRDILMPVARY